MLEHFIVWKIQKVNNFIEAQESLSPDRRFISLACFEDKIFLLYRMDLPEVYDWSFAEVFGSEDIDALVESNPEGLRVAGCNDNYFITATHYGWGVGGVSYIYHYSMAALTSWINSRVEYAASGIFTGTPSYTILFTIYNNSNDILYSWVGEEWDWSQGEDIDVFLEDIWAVDARLASNGERFFLLWR